MQEPENNPYAAPEANLSGQESYAADGEVSRGILVQLAGTKGWARLMSVLLDIFGVMMIIAAVAGSQSRFAESVMQSRLFNGLFWTLIVGVGAITYGVLLGSFCSAISRVLYSRRVGDLEEALVRQRNFWIYWGIVSLLLLIVSVAGFFVS